MRTRLGLLLVTAALIGGSAAPVRDRDIPTSVDVIRQVNIARASPDDLARLIRGLEPNFKGNVYHDRTLPAGLVTIEGPRAYQDAATYLSGRPPVPPVEMSNILNEAALAHVLEQGPLGTTGHFSADGTGPGGRVKRLGGDVFVAEAVTYGPFDAEGVVRQLAVDDGVRDRGHRHILFSPEYHYAGAACGPHKTFGEMCVVEFSATPNGAPKAP